MSDQQSLLKRMSLEDRIAVVRAMYPEASEEELEAHLRTLEEAIGWSEGEGRAERDASFQRYLQEKTERQEQEAEREASFQCYVQEEFQRCLKELQEQAGE
jgi:ABC-type nitrate/sulfonate/bicarbonate transport system substrate-binding protein